MIEWKKHFYFFIGMCAAFAFAWWLFEKSAPKTIAPISIGTLENKDARVDVFELRRGSSVCWVLLQENDKSAFASNMVCK